MCLFFDLREPASGRGYHDNLSNNSNHVATDTTAPTRKTNKRFAFMQLHNTYNYAVIKKLKSMLETSNKELNITSLVGRCQYVLYHQNIGDYCSSDTY